MLRNFINTLRRYTLASVLNILGLSVAFAAFIIIMMQVSFDRSFDRFHPKADRIYKVDIIDNDSVPITVVPRALAEILCPDNPQIQSYALYEPAWGETFFTIDRDGTKYGFNENINIVYPGFLDIVDLQLTEGTAAEFDKPDKVLVPESTAKKLFANESPIGKSLVIDTATSYQVAGVYKDFPANSQFVNTIMARFPDDWGKDKDGNYRWSQWNYLLYVVLTENTDPKEIETRFAAKVKELNLEKELKGIELTSLPNLYLDTRTVELDYLIKHGKRDTVNLMMAIALLILVIAGINFVNFSTSLAPMRMKSINIQKVLGSLNGKLRMMLIVEAIGLCVISFGIALLIVYLLGESSFRDITMSGITLKGNSTLIIQTGLIALTLGVVAGIYPAFYTTRFSPVMVLKGSFAMSPMGRMLRTGLIGIQFVVSISLIVGAMIMQLQNRHMQNADTGYNKENLAMVNLGGKLAGNKVFEQKLLQNPIIQDVAYAQYNLLSSNQSQGWNFTHHDKKVEPRTLIVSWDFPKMIGVKMVEGEYPTQESTKSPTMKFIFNEKAAKEFDIKVGDRFEWGGDGAEAAGIINDINFMSLHNEIGPMMFVIAPEQWSGWVTVAHIKIKGDPYAAADFIRKTAAQIDPVFPISIEFTDQAFELLYEKDLKTTKMISLFSAIAIIISLVGVFGLVVFETQYRRKEIGLRKINGATTASILVMFNRKFIWIVGVCFVIAAPLAWYGVNEWLKGFAYRTPMHWWVFALALLIVLTITLLTVTIQSWRAATENPVNSLKSE